jgi:hypothetical protein
LSIGLTYDVRETERVQMDMIPLKTERKAPLEESAKRRGQDPPAAMITPWQLIWSGKARTSRRPLREFVEATKI